MKEDMLKTQTTAAESENTASVNKAPNQETKSRVFEILEELTSMSIQDPNLILIQDLGMDSLRMVMLLVTIEDTFDIELDESDMNPFSLITVQNVVDLVMKYVSPEEVSDNA